MGLQFSEIDDAVKTTQEEFIKKGSFVDMQTSLSNHIAVREMWQGRKKVFAGGESWDFDVQMDHNHSARTVGLYEADSSSLNDTMAKGSVKVRHINAHYIYDLHEPAFQRGSKMIVNLVKTKYTAMMVSLFELLEELLWSKPVDSSDTKTPFGISYWITRSATEGFSGGNPAGFTDGKAGLSALTYTRWQNWTAQYVNVTKEDLIRKMRKAHRMSRFRSPVSHATPALGGMKNGIYLNGDTLGLFEEAAEAQNMNLGKDVASMDGRTLFKGSPLVYVPKLDDDTADPVYMIDWEVLAIGVLAGWENNLGSPYPVPNMHNVRRVDLDASLNMVATDLRRLAVISK